MNTTPKAQLLDLIEQAPESHLGPLLRYAQRLQTSTAAEALTACLDSILAASQPFEDADHPETLPDFCDRVVAQTQTLQSSNELEPAQGSPFSPEVQENPFNGQATHSIFSDETEVELNEAILANLPDPLQNIVQSFVPAEMNDWQNTSNPLPEPFGRIIGCISAPPASKSIDEELYE